MNRFAITFLLLALPLSAHAQDWRLDDSLKALATQQRDELVKGIQKAPEQALKGIVDEETSNLQKLHQAEVEAFGKEAWARVLQGKEDGRLFRAVGAELKKAGVYSWELTKKIWAEERARLSTFPDRAVYGLVDRVLKAALVNRLQALKTARLEAFRIDRGASAVPANFPLDLPDQHFAWRRTEESGMTLDSTKLPLPKITFFSKSAKIEEALYKKTWKTNVGDLTVTAAEVSGLAKAEAGKVSYTDAFGHEVTGLGVNFTAKARMTGARGDFRSKDVEAAGNDLAFHAYLNAMAALASNVEATSTTILTEDGFGTNNVIKAGAGASATASLPITIDLKVLKLHVIPYASAHAGVSAEAHATFEVEWTGKIRFDLGASFSSGVGVGAGLVVEVELGKVLRDAIDRLIERINHAVRPIADFFMGRTWKGPVADTKKLVLSLEDMERGWAEGAAAPRPALANHEQVAQRYAPVIYQQVTRGWYDLLRRVDFDGDWNTTNNWDHTTKDSDRSAWVYYDVKETETHYFITYAFYYSGRASNAVVGLLRNARRHENDMSGCMVVVRKDAPRGREVEVLFTGDGEEMHTYSALEPKDGEKTRWSTNNGFWSGPVRFVDEADHPWVDLERTHPQVWVDGKGHEAYGFTGRDDVDASSGGEGITYYPKGQAEQPSSFRDSNVGYALRPLSELWAHATDKDAFTVKDRVRPEGAVTSVPRRMRGDEGPDDQAVPPWAWGYWQQDRQHNDKDDSSTRSRDEFIEEGDVFVDPVRALKILFRAPNVSATYLSNPWKQGGQLSGPATLTAEGRRLDEESRRGLSSAVKR
ncbi:MAG: hypothetical protein AB7T09_31490 [Planctomycetota bacterium]